MLVPSSRKQSPTMLAVITLAFVICCGLELWAAHTAIVAGGKLRNSYFALLAIAMLAAAWRTYGFEYHSNENTRIQGWPVPAIVFQRDDPGAPWVDFVGPTTILALPMNFIAFMPVPSVVVLGLAHWRNRKESTL
jgi:hypothetical protein